MSKKVIVLISLSFVVVAAMCGALIPFFTNSGGSPVLPEIPSHAVSTDQSGGDTPGEPETITPPDTSSETIPEEDISGTFYATYAGLSLWVVEPFDFSFGISDINIKDSEISIHFFSSNNTFYIPNSDATWTGTKIYLVNSSDTYILCL